MSRRIDLFLLLVAVIPTGIAGVIGIRQSRSALHAETLRNLDREVAARAGGVALAHRAGRGPPRRPFGEGK